MAEKVLATRLTEQHAAEIATLEGEQLKRTAEIYQAARERVAAKLADAAEDTFTAQSLRTTQAQIDSGLLTMAEKLEARAGWFASQATEMGVQQMIEQIVFWDSKFQGGAATKIAHGALQKVITPQNLLLDKYRSSIASYSQSLRAETGRRLGTHLAMRSPWRDMAQDVAGSLRESAIDGAQWRAERIVRTEMVDALSLGHQATLEEAVEIIPGLKRQWDAVLDMRTSEVCETLNGQVREVNQPWMWRGRAIMRPPAIPNCRSRILAYHDDWAREEAELEEEVAQRRPVRVDMKPGKKGGRVVGDESESAKRRRIAGEKKAAKEHLKQTRKEFVEGVAEGADSEALRSGLYDAIERAAKFQGLRNEDEAYWIAKRFAQYSEESSQARRKMVKLKRARREWQRPGRESTIPPPRKSGIVDSQSKWTGEDGKLLPSRVAQHKEYAADMRLRDPKRLPAARKALEAAEAELVEVADELASIGADRAKKKALVAQQKEAKKKVRAAKKQVKIESDPNVIHYTPVPEGEQKVYLGLGGGPGTGKGTIQKAGQVVPLENQPVLNADDAKERFSEYIAGKRRKDPRIAGFVHEESSSVVKRGMADAMEAGQHVALDGTGDGGMESIGKKIGAARKNGYRTIGEYTTCSLEEATERAMFRQATSARSVPDDIMYNVHRQVSRDFLDFKDLDNFWDELRLWDTSVEFGKPARLVYERVGGVETIHNPVLWERFKRKATVPDYVKPNTLQKRRRMERYRDIEQAVAREGKKTVGTRLAKAQAQRMAALERQGL